jgi:hypothetical protein
MRNTIEHCLNRGFEPIPRQPAADDIGDDARPDPVPMLAACPAEWVPADFPGQCLFDRDVPARFYEAFVPPSQFRHYTRITRDDTIALYPSLAQLAQ